jgi:hypothetical protein
MKYPG